MCWQNVASFLYWLNIKTLSLWVFSQRKFRFLNYKDQINDPSANQILFSEPWTLWYRQKGCGVEFVFDICMFWDYLVCEPRRRRLTYPCQSLTFKIDMPFGPRSECSIYLSISSSEAWLQVRNSVWKTIRLPSSFNWYRQILLSNLFIKSEGHDDIWFSLKFQTSWLRHGQTFSVRWKERSWKPVRWIILIQFM